MATRFIIGRGELLTYPITPAPMGGSKAHPYTLAEAQHVLIPQINRTARELRSLPQAACPRDIAVAKLDLHPAYIAKSYFPSGLLRQTGLTAVGSRTIRVRPRFDVRKTATEESDTTQLFVAGTRAAFERLPAYARQLQEYTGEAIQFAEIEAISSMTPEDRLRIFDDGDGRTFEVGLHLLPDDSADGVRKAFTAYAASCGFKVNTEFDFPVGRMLFVAVQGDRAGLEQLALFSLLRVLRPMPALRSSRPVVRSSPLALGFNLPNPTPLSAEPTVAILDGGLPEDHVLNSYVRRYEKSDPTAADSSEFLDHGLSVTSAFLFGPIEPRADAARPYSYVDHIRVLDAVSKTEDPFELYRTLAHIEDVLLSRRYQFLNLSLGPDLPIEDTDVHAWTAVLDTHLSDGGTLMTVAVGNNGELDSTAGLNRIQVPSDSVNALSVGAADHTTAAWARAPYSACGPGRSPGRLKPDLVVFGGSPKEYFHVVQPGRRPQVAATLGTSFASPYALRTAVGIRAVLGEEIHPLTIKALMIHGTEGCDSASYDEVGWGRVPQDLNDLITCEDGMARIVYQGRLRPGKYLRAPLPLPAGQLTGNVRLTATFCYASPVDVEDAASYTCAGLGITFRPHAEKGTGKQAKTTPFFSKKTFRTEQEQRSDLGKWETVLHATRDMRGSSLKEATFDIHYNARDGGGPAGSGTELIQYALVLTVHAHRHASLYEDILAAHSVLKAIQPLVQLPLRT
ncbi:S8 family peptidase [Sphaerotilaceae bacterium SBD11-9]